MRGVYEDSNLVSGGDTAMVEVLEGEVMQGWNIYEDFAYNLLPNRANPGQANNPFYVGPQYIRYRYLQDMRFERRISMAIEKYRETGDYQGPTPEWWKCIQTQRIYRDSVPGDDYDTWYEITKRRPTAFEFRSQAYRALAAGARGITQYCYTSQDTGDYPDHSGFRELDGDQIEPGYVDNELWYDGELDSPTWRNPKVHHGIVSSEWTYENDTFVWGDFREPFSATLPGVNADDSQEDSQGENYQNDHPWDSVKELYANMEELLPIMRDLRWWWAEDGSNQYFDDSLSASEEVPHYPLSHAFYDTFTRHENTTIHDRFSLRRIAGDDETLLTRHNNVDSLYYSNILVGMFDNVAEGDLVEYYLIVNMDANDWDSNESEIICDSTVIDTLNLSFLDLDSALTEVTIEWKDDSFTTQNQIVLKSQPHQDTMQVDLTIHQGDAVLLRVEIEKPDSASVEYTTATTIQGPLHYAGDVTFSGSGTSTLDGEFIFDGDLIVKGANTVLEIESGSILKFASGKKVSVSQHGALDVSGVPGDSVYFGPSTVLPDTTGLWQGIVFVDTLDNESFVECAVIRHATTGVSIVDATDAVRVRGCEIAYCDTAVFGSDGYQVSVDTSHVYRCKFGIFGSTPTCSTWFTVRSCLIEEVDEIGVELNNVWKGVISGSTIQNIGEIAVKVKDLNYLYMNGSPDTPAFPDTSYIRYNGAEASIYSEPAVLISSSHVQRLNYSMIYENQTQGLVLNSGTDLIYVPSNPENSDDIKGVMIANNFVSMASAQNGLDSEILFGGSSSIDIDTSYFQIFNDNLNGRSTDPHIFSNYQKNSILWLRANWWKDISTVAGWLNRFHDQYGDGGDAATVLLSPFATLSENLKHDYWNISGGAEPAVQLRIAYGLIDSMATEAQIRQAASMFSDLTEEGYLPSILGLENVYRRLGAEPEEIVRVLQEHLPHEDSAGYESMRSLVNLRSACVYRKFGQYDRAIQALGALADTVESPVDSLHALIEQGETVRLQNMVARPARDAGGHQPQARVARAQNIIQAEKAVRRYHQELHDYYATQSASRPEIPQDYEISAVYPNPFNPTVSIVFAMPKRSDVKVVVFNVLGQRVAEVINEKRSAGLHTVLWNSQSATVPASSGIYFVRMEAGGVVQTKKIVLLK